MAPTTTQQQATVSSGQRRPSDTGPRRWSRSLRQAVPLIPKLMFRPRTHCVPTAPEAGRVESCFRSSAHCGNRMKSSPPEAGSAHARHRFRDQGGARQRPPHGAPDGCQAGLHPRREEITTEAGARTRATAAKIAYQLLTSRDLRTLGADPAGAGHPRYAARMHTAGPRSSGDRASVS
jgi:hypothetical protein